MYGNLWVSTSKLGKENLPSMSPLYASIECLCSERISWWTEENFFVDVLSKCVRATHIVDTKWRSLVRMITSQVSTKFNPHFVWSSSYNNRTPIVIDVTNTAIVSLSASATSTAVVSLSASAPIGYVTVTAPVNVAFGGVPQYQIIVSSMCHLMAGFFIFDAVVCVIYAFAVDRHWCIGGRYVSTMPWHMIRVYSKLIYKLRI